MGYETTMSGVERVVEVTPEKVWDVLADGWLYPLWVVGASRMRDVDETWPQPGARLHHSVGSWPVLLNDTTSVLESNPEHLLRLQARAWPSGEAHVAVHLSAVGGHTLVRIEEDVESGPARLIPRAVRLPGMAWRNVESLRRLAYVAERR